MATKVGKDAKVTLGANTVAEMGTWTMDGITNDTLEDTVFQDEFKMYQYGLGDGGTITFSGFFDMTDTTGQIMLESAARNKSTISNLRVYVDNTSYYEPNQTTANGPASNVLIQKFGAVSFEKAGIGTIEFTAKVSGVMFLV